jgi:hypothetical protein
MIQPRQSKPAPPRAAVRVSPKLEQYVSRRGKPCDVKASARETYGCVEWFDYCKHPLEPQRGQDAS